MMQERKNQVTIGQESTDGIPVLFVREGTQEQLLPQGEAGFFTASFLQTALWPLEGRMTLLVGLGKKKLDRMKVKEAGAKAVAECRAKKFASVSLDISLLVQEQGIEAVRDVVEGACLSTYHLPCFGEKEEELAETPGLKLHLTGVAKEQQKQAEQLAEEASVLAEGVMFARDLVNLPGNHLRPQDFARQITGRMNGLPVECVCYERNQLKEMGMEGLLAVGDSSEFPPCLLVLRYQGAADSRQTIGLVGKGVTCDTGGYCLKAAGSMLGIKGDMAGGAAVAGAVYALAKQQVAVNATAVIPMCENRISSGSFLPGDVISSYAGKTIEVGNTDAEGRLILADAVAYAVKDEKVTKLLDIATLTGAVATMLGFSVAGVLCDEEEWYQQFERAYQASGERYLRVPFYDEHEKMIESDLADVRNMSKDGCGTITAGLFIRRFAEERPWLHLDIAGTAWVDSPVFAFQAKGATGAGVTTIYQLCRGEE